VASQIPRANLTAECGVCGVVCDNYRIDKKMTALTQRVEALEKNKADDAIL
jgi:hypothetical protein